MTFEIQSFYTAGPFQKTANREMGTQITTKEHHQHSSNRAHTRASLHFIRPLNATFALVCELCQLVAISSSLRGTRPEESSQISRLVALEQSLATWLRRVLAAAAGITRAAYFFKSCNRRTENSYYRGTVKPGWNHFRVSYAESDDLEIGVPIADDWGVWCE